MLQVKARPRGCSDHVGEGEIVHVCDGLDRLVEAAAGLSGASEDLGVLQSADRMLDPRTDGKLVDPRWNLFHVPVRVEFEAETAEDRVALHPTITIEVLNARTGALASFYAYQGSYLGGVSVAAGDLN